MKKFNRIKMILSVAVATLVALFTIACRAPLVNSLVSSTWSLNFNLCEYPDKAAEVFESFDIKITAKTVSFKIEHTDEFLSAGGTCELRNGTYAISSFSSRNNSELYVDLSTGNYMWVQKDTIKLYSVYVDYSDDSGTNIGNVCFTKSGAAFVPSDGGGGGGSNTQSRFTEIKAAYTTAGYNVDIGENDFDSSIAALVTQLKDTYAAMGCELCWIGKNTDDPTMMSTELYMLLRTPTEKDAKETEDGLKAAYSCARNGKDLIVYIWPMGTANFAPFNSAVK